MLANENRGKIKKQYQETLKNEKAIKRENISLKEQIENQESKMNSL